MFEKGDKFFQLISNPILWSEVFYSLKNCSFEVNYLVRGGDQPIFYEVFFLQKNLQDQCKHACSCSKVSRAGAGPGPSPHGPGFGAKPAGLNFWLI
jgi:hypothetical protein